MMRASRFASALALCALSCATPQTPSAPPALASPESAGMSSEQLARLTARMQEFDQDGRIPGVVTLVWRKGWLVHNDVIGYQDVASKTPMRRDTLFRIASMSKPITSVAVLMLVEDGKLDLSDPVERWLPELANPRVLFRPNGSLARTRPAPRAITVLDLLTHRSGLTYPDLGNSPLSRALSGAGLSVFSSPLASDEWIKQLGQLPLAYAPGMRWNYGFSTDVLGVLVERVAGMPFAEFLRTRLFEPLDMKDTAFWVPADKLDRLATLYAADPKTHQLVATDRPPETPLASPPAFASGGAGLVSTADDYLRFGRMLLGKGELDGARILSPAMVERMTTNQLTLQQRRVRGGDMIDGFGLGVSVIDAAARPILTGPASQGTHGWAGAYGTWYSVDPEQGLVAVLMIQLTGGIAPVVPTFGTAIYQAIVE